MSILAADLLHVGRDLERIERAGASLVHVDIMDGHRTPSISVGPRFVAALETTLLLDVHVLVDNPERVMSDLQGVGADVVTVQIETTKDPLDSLRALTQVPSRRWPGEHAYRGIAISADSDPDALLPFLDELDLVVVLGVELQTLRPFALGQVVDRVRHLRDLSLRSDVLVSVDGGVTLENVTQLARADPHIVVAGSALFAGTFEEQVAVYRDRAEVRAV